MGGELEGAEHRGCEQVRGVERKARSREELGCAAEREPERELAARCGRDDGEGSSRVETELRLHPHQRVEEPAVRVDQAVRQRLAARPYTALRDRVNLVRRLAPALGHAR